MLLWIFTVISLFAAVICFAFDIITHIYWIPAVFGLSFMVLVLCWLGFCFICTRFIDMKKICQKHSPFFRFCANCIIESVTQFLRIKLHVTGMEILPSEKFLLVGNHQSSMDPLLTMNVLRNYNMGFVAKKEVFRIPIIGRLMNKCFCLSLDKENMREQAKIINQAADTIKAQTASMGIYPEGTRNYGDELLPFMNGAFKIAKKAECPIVVAVIRNAELISKRTPFRRTDVYLDFIDVLERDFVKENSTAKISEYVREVMRKKISEIHTTE